jgi:hypothetical protein
VIGKLTSGFPALNLHKETPLKTTAAGGRLCLRAALRPTLGRGDQSAQGNACSTHSAS